MFRFAFRNLLTKKVQTVLIILSITLSAGVAVLSYNIANQVSEGITGTAGYYSAIIGPAGSKTQLAMNTMYFTDEPLGTIPYDICTDLQRDSRVKEVIPFAMADSYNGYGVVGSTSAFLSSKTLQEGKMFDDKTSFEVVVGYNVAKTCSLHIGSEIHTSHSAGDEHHQAFTVVGILNRTHTVYDNTVFTELSSIWKVHEHEEDHEHEEGHEEDHEHEEEYETEEIPAEVSEEKDPETTEAADASEPKGHGAHGAKNTQTEKTEEKASEEGHEDHDHAGENMVCSILVKTKNPSFAMTLVNDFDGRIWSDEDGCQFPLSAIEPMGTVRAVLEETNTTKYIVYALCGIILAMNIMVVSIITLLNLHHSAKEIELMRLIGISLKKINLVYLVENSLAGLISGILAFALSRICLLAAQGFVSDMGIVLNLSKLYPVEILILLAVFLLSVIPTIICTSVMARRSDLT